jgi:hypothetical protein
MASGKCMNCKFGWELKLQRLLDIECRRFPPTPTSVRHGNVGTLVSQASPRMDKNDGCGEFQKKGLFR